LLLLLLFLSSWPSASRASGHAKRVPRRCSRAHALAKEAKANSRSGLRTNKKNYNNNNNAIKTTQVRQQQQQQQQQHQIEE